MIRLAAAFVLTVFGAVMTVAGAQAQVPKDTAARIAWLTAAEDRLLGRRNDLLRAEAGLEEPLWIVNDRGVVSVVDGTPIYDHALILIELAASTELDREFGLTLMPLYRGIADLMVAGQVQAPRDRVKESYESASGVVRRDTLAGFERQLDALRAELARTK